MKELQFIGNGSAFNTSLGNTSAFIKRNDSLLLIDCGGTTFHKLQKLNLLDNIKELYIVITHTHPDHVGSLGEVIFYSYYILGKEPTIFFPHKELMEKFLKSIGVGDEMYHLNTSNMVEVNDIQFGKLNIEFLSVSHVDTIPAYGFLIKLDDKLFYYSGDANNIDASIITRMKKGEIYRIYQDTCGLDYEGNNHLSLKRLCEIVPQEWRNRVYCMHLDKYITREEIEEKGFRIVQVYK